jgi:hypothetical protein
MSPFEYVIVLISIILGMGITLVLTGIAKLIRKVECYQNFLALFDLDRIGFRIAHS